jgi:hypothetical protein
MPCVQYLIQHGAWDNTRPLRVETYGVRGQAACVEYALDHGVALHRASLVMAASFGDLSVVRLLHSRGFPLWYMLGDTDLWPLGCVWEYRRDGKFNPLPSWRGGVDACWRT